MGEAATLAVRLARPLGSHPADRGQLAEVGPANQEGRREADSTDQLRPGRGRVEVRVLWHRLTTPLPAGVSHVIGFLFGLAPQSPSRTLTDILMSM
jgi:hypothetical protein